MARKPRRTEHYSSPAMRARRQRILAETRSLIADHGVSGFNLVELCERADVAKQTLYYTFKSKEGLIAAAILDYFETFDETIQYRGEVGTLERLIERVVAIGQRNLTIRNYVGAIVSVYFAPHPGAELWSTIHEVASAPQRAYIATLARARRLQPWIDEKLLADTLVMQRYALSNDWLQGRIGDAELIDRMVINLLTFLLGSVRGGTRREIEEVLRSIAANGAVAYVNGLAKQAA